MQGAQGHLLIIGGHEDRVGELAILSRFVALAGGSAARIVMVTHASAMPAPLAAIYTAAFTRLGVASFVALPADDRLDANDPALAKQVEGATGVLLSGGEQLRLTSEVGGTLLERAIRGVYLRGGVVAGTSAGAAALGETIILSGDSDATVSYGQVQLGPGLDLINNLLIDQHFNQRDRLYRLIGALAINPGQLAVGIDEDTALLIGPDGIGEVVGSGAVTILDGSRVTFGNIAEVKAGRPLAITDLILHILTAGMRYDLRARSVMLA